MDIQQDRKTQLCNAKAVWKSEIEGEYESAGFEITVSVDVVTNNIGIFGMAVMKENINDGKCDGFIVEIGDDKKYIL